jgi:ribonucleoside-diphosphate reductase alpha subunit
MKFLEEKQSMSPKRLVSYVIKRNGQKQAVSFDKITERIAKLINPVELQKFNLSEIIQENDFLDPTVVSQKVIANLYSGISTQELDLQSAIICQNMSTLHPSYSKLGGRILVSNLHKNTFNTFSEKVKLLSEQTNFLNSAFINYVLSNTKELDAIVDYDRDYLYDYFGYKTLEKAYLQKAKGQIIERPQDMIMRVAITLNIDYISKKGDLDAIKKTYELMSMGYYTHATPTLYNSGTRFLQLSSCFLGEVPDNLKGIEQSWINCAEISRWAGGIGLSVSKVRAKESKIKTTGESSNGLIPLLKMYDQLARYVNQGGKRPGSIAIYLEPYHPDIHDFLELRKNFGDDTQRARDLFLALWVPDLFMKLVESDSEWYLLCPDTCPDLAEKFGDEFEELYWKYVNEGKYKSKISARKLWLQILESQIETGMPYIGFKDAVNKKNNQKNLGTIKNSNLCIEIAQFSSDKEYAVCNLASISLRHFVKPYINDESNKWIIYSKPNCKFCKYAKNYMTFNKYNFEEVTFSQENLDKLKTILQKETITFPQIFLNEKTKEANIGGWSDLYSYTASSFDYSKLYDVAYTATINLNKVIDINFYPIPETKLSNMKHRPIGLGIQGLADTLALMRIPFDSEKAVELNAKVSETIYLASITASNHLAKVRNEDFREFNKLLKILDIEINKIPEFYDSSFNINENNILKIINSYDDETFDCEDEKYFYYCHPSKNTTGYYRDTLFEPFNILYHKLKPNIYEITNLKDDYLGAYSSFNGSYFSEGKFQFDLWGVKPTRPEWENLRKSVVTFGTRNSLTTALMPTASTSQILGNNECFEYFTNNIYTRNTQAGDFVMTNKYMVNDLLSVGLWDSDMKDRIIACNGSIQKIDTIPEQIRNLYKTIWEIGQIWVLKAALARSPYIDQMQSMNLFMGEPDFQRLGSSHMWAWKNGLKTGQYYLRTKPAADAIKFTIDPNLMKEVKKQEDKECTTCSA